MRVVVAIVLFLCASFVTASVVPGFPFSDGKTQCQYYKDNYNDNAELKTTTGVDVSSCQAGAVTTAADNAMLKAVNMFRYFCGIPPVKAIDHSQDVNTQDCALMCAANNVLQHTGWVDTATCYSSQGATGCGSSNLAEGVSSPSGVVSLWVSDSSNIAEGPNTCGHRRWILAPDLGGISFGLVEDWASLYVFGTQKGRIPHKYSWPPEGTTPLAAVNQWGAMPWNFADVSFTADSLNIISCTVTASGSSTNLVGACYYNGPGYGPWGSIFMPFTTTNVAGCFDVAISYTDSEDKTKDIAYTVNLWDCTLHNGGAKCLNA